MAEKGEMREKYNKNENESNIEMVFNFFHLY